MLHITYRPEIGERLSERLSTRAPEVLERIKLGHLSKLGHYLELVDDRIRIIDDRSRKTDYRIGKILAKLIDHAPTIEKLTHLITSPDYSIEILTGADIAATYVDESEYHTQHDGPYSCMRYQDPEVFDLYSHNPQRIGLLVIRDYQGSYCGRCLIYMKDGAPLYHSRKFYMKREHELAARTWLESHEITQIGLCTWKLDRTEFDRYPYLDDFRGVSDRGLADSDVKWLCNQTDGYADEQGRPCECCGGPIRDDDDLRTVGDQIICEDCFSSNYTTIESGHTCYLFNNDDLLSHRRFIIDEDLELIAERSDCVEETSREESSYSSTEWVTLSNGDCGTLEEIQENYTQIGDYWTNELLDWSDYATDGYSVGRIADAVENY